MKPSSSIMTIYDTFIQALFPLEDKKEERANRDKIYMKEEPTNELIHATSISLKKYGKI